MKVIIQQNFEGYPDGPDKPSRHYVAGKESIDVSDDFGKLIVGKGLAVAAGGVVSADLADGAEGTHAAQ